MQTFYPAHSNGALWVMATPMLVTVLTLPALASGAIPVLLFDLVLLVPFGLLASWISTMHYELGPEELVLCYGPFRWPIKLQEIRRVWRQDLTLSLWSSVRFPGFAAFGVPTGNMGNVHMCATRSLKDILLIETDRRRYGITPADEEVFARLLTYSLQRV